MNGETNLQTLIKHMSPQLQDGEYVFLCFKNALYGEHANLHPIASIIEEEGLTLVVDKSRADAHDLTYSGSFKRITLCVHSSLQAVGLTAAFATQLTESNISANVIAGFYHDHIFVPSEQAERALLALQQLKNHC